MQSVKNRNVIFEKCLGPFYMETDISVKRDNSVERYIGYSCYSCLYGNVVFRIVSAQCLYDGECLYDRHAEIARPTDISLSQTDISACRYISPPI